MYLVDLTSRSDFTCKAPPPFPPHTLNPPSLINNLSPIRRVRLRHRSLDRRRSLCHDRLWQHPSPQTALGSLRHAQAGFQLRPHPAHLQTTQLPFQRLRLPQETFGDWAFCVHTVERARELVEGWGPNA